uniref:O-methyltransferase n=1 Tax=Scoparia dulcis TaxID=107240 RepID=A0A5H2QA01_SCODU|nr:O-methyltransferase [Scoparia dulcis]
MENTMNDQQSLELLQAEAHIWNHVFHYINSMSLKCAVELGIPDVIHKHSRPITLSELVEALEGINPDKCNSLYRLMRILVHSGTFAIEKIHSSSEEGYVLTSASRLLVENHPLSMKPFVLSQLDPFLTEPWNHLSRWFRSTDDPIPFQTATGMSFWEKKAKNPTFSRMFDETMASDTPMVADVIVRNRRHLFEGLESLVDVAGGTGTLARAIADAFPQIQCTVLDLPSVVGGLEGTANLKFVEGDMFHHIPPADAVLLKWILHDWNDHESTEILKKCKEAVTSKCKQGKAIIIEMVVDNKTNTTNSTSHQTQLFFDMAMMTAVGGKERSEKEWAKLFANAGFSHYKIFPLDLELRSIIEVYP